MELDLGGGLTIRVFALNGMPDGIIGQAVEGRSNGLSMVDAAFEEKEADNDDVAEMTFGELRGEITSLRGEVENLQAQVSGQARHARRLVTERDEIRTRLREAEEARAELQRRVAGRDHQLQGREREVATLQDERDRARAGVAEVERQLKASEAEVQDLKAKLANAEKHSKTGWDGYERTAKLADRRAKESSSGG